MTDADAPIKPLYLWLADQQNGDKDNKSEHDYAAQPNFVSLFGGLRLFLGFADPVAVQDLYIANNSQVDKTGIWEKLFKSFVGSSFVFSKADATWKAKRQAIAHAFYKDRLSMMLDALKTQMIGTMEAWLAQFDKNGEIEIELGAEV